MVLDNLKVHTSEETKKYLASIPGRFEFVFTPKHGPWLNLVEGFFSKLTRQSLKGIRVNTKEEPVERIYKYFDEVNAYPVVYHRKYRLEEIDSGEQVQVDTFPEEIFALSELRLFLRVPYFPFLTSRIMLLVNVKAVLFYRKYDSCSHLVS